MSRRPLMSLVWVLFLCLHLAQRLLVRQTPLMLFIVGDGTLLVSWVMGPVTIVRHPQLCSMQACVAMPSAALMGAPGAGRGWGARAVRRARAAPERNGQFERSAQRRRGELWLQAAVRGCDGRGAGVAALSVRCK